MPTRTVFRSGDILTIRESRWRVASSIAYGATSVVQAVGCDAANRAERASFLLPFESCTRARITRPRVVSPRRWRRVARAALSQATPFWWSLRAAAAADFAILPFQLEPALAMVRGDASRFLIADAVGLGKTVQAGLMIGELSARQIDVKAIVVSPAGLRDQWCDELRRRFSLDARIVDATSMARSAAELPPHVNPWSIPAVAVTSIDYLKRPEVIRGLEGLVWDIAVFDEAHNLATYSDRAAAATLVAERARHVVLLTATPHSGDDETFARLCGLGRLDDHDKLVVFRRSRRDIGVDSRTRVRLIRIEPTAAERGMHRALLAYTRDVWRRAHASPGARLAASVLTRRACSSATSLARSIERRLAIIAATSDDGEHQVCLPFGDAGPLDAEPDWQLASPGLADISQECRRLEAILELAGEAAGHESKIAALQRLLARIDEPAIVFTEYRDTLSQLVVASGVPDALQLHGGLTARERAAVLRQFADGSSRLLLATDAGSEGLNLHHHCRLVINLELPWMPRRLEQRGGRVDRIGQSKRAHVLSLVAKGTCEEEILARLATRLLRAEKALDLFSPGPSEEHVAAMVLGDEQTASLQPPAAPPGVVTASVDDSEAEAVRIRTARQMIDAGTDGSHQGGAVLTCIHGRRGTRRARRFWLFTFACCTPQGQVVWQPVAAIQACSARRISGSMVETRLALDPAALELWEPVRRYMDDIARAASKTLSGPANQWIAREEAIVTRLRARHARLSAPLLQPGLFDRRADRQAAEYHAALQEALSRSSVRLAHLSGRNDLKAEDMSLVFGLLLE